jgi:glycogen debranching enzyme
MVGHQDGTFPDLGWHIEGEMGGIWNHPIKLMDGFDIQITEASESFKLNKADKFTNYPVANVHSFSWKDKKLEIERWQFVPDDKQGLIVQLIIKNHGKERNLNLKFTGHPDIIPTWLGDETGMEDGKDQSVFDSEKKLWKVKDDLNEWYALFGNDKETSVEKTSLNTLEDTISLKAEETYVINYVIAGSYTSEQEAYTTYNDIKNNMNSYLTAKRERYEELANRSKLTVPDKDIEQAFEWIKYSCDWTIRTIPEVGSGMCAGLPDYPWWFSCDAEYALKNHMAFGQFETAYNTIHLLDSISEVTNGNGRIAHEISTNGAVFNKGNVNETPQFASLIWDLYKWTGDINFLKRYFPTVKKGLNWVMTERDENNNLLPDGYGMMEIEGLDREMIDISAYLQRAFIDASKMASEIGDNKLADEYKTKAIALKEKINSVFWSEESKSYGDFIATDEQALKTIANAIERAEDMKQPWVIEELKKKQKYIKENPSSEIRAFAIYHSYVVNTPMEMNFADEDKALIALETAKKFTSQFGVYVTGIDKDTREDTNNENVERESAFSYESAVMPMNAGVLAVSENNYGRPNEALDYIKKATTTFSYAYPGGMYEVSPDFGMMNQTFNNYAYGVPIVNQFFGIDPQAAKKKVVIKPQMPDTWDNASLENVLIADNTISVYYTKSDGLLTLRVEQENSDWEVEIILPKEDNINSFEVTKSSVEPEIVDGKYVFDSKASTTELVLKYE